MRIGAYPTMRSSTLVPLKCAFYRAGGGSEFYSDTFSFFVLFYRCCEKFDSSSSRTRRGGGVGGVGRLGHDKFDTFVRTHMYLNIGTVSVVV